MRQTCDEEPERNMWMCGMCGQIEYYDCGRWVDSPNEKQFRYACQLCQEDVLDDGGRILSDMEAVQLGLCELSDADAMVRCCICGHAESCDGPSSEDAHDVLRALGWSFGPDGARCPGCKDRIKPTMTIPRWYKDIFAE